jgi:hypothetical protein
MTESYYPFDGEEPISKEEFANKVLSTYRPLFKSEEIGALLSKALERDNQEKRNQEDIIDGGPLKKVRSGVLAESASPNSLEPAQAKALWDKIKHDAVSGEALKNKFATLKFDYLLYRLQAADAASRTGAPLTVVELTWIVGEDHLPVNGYEWGRFRATDHGDGTWTLEPSGQVDPSS